MSSVRIGGRGVSRSEGGLDEQFGILLRGRGINRTDRNPAVLRNIRDPRVEEMPPIRKKDRQYVAACASGFVQCRDGRWNAAGSRNTHYRCHAEDNLAIPVPRTGD